MKNLVVVLAILAVGYLGYGFMTASSKEAYQAYQDYASARVKEDLIYTNLAMTGDFRVEGVSYDLESKESAGNGGKKFVVFQKVGIIYTRTPALIQHRMRHYVTMSPDGDVWTVESLEIELLDNKGQHLPGTDIWKVI